MLANCCVWNYTPARNTGSATNCGIRVISFPRLTHSFFTLSIPPTWRLVVTIRCSGQILGNCSWQQTIAQIKSKHKTSIKVKGKSNVHLYSTIIDIAAYATSTVLSLQTEPAYSLGHSPSPQSADFVSIQGLFFAPNAVQVVWRKGKRSSRLCRSKKFFQNALLSASILSVCWRHRHGYKYVERLRDLIRKHDFLLNSKKAREILVFGTQRKFSCVRCSNGMFYYPRRRNSRKCGLSAGNSSEPSAFRC